MSSLPSAARREKSSVKAIIREFLVSYPKQFALLSAILLVGGIVGMIAVLAVVPLADFLLDPGLKAPSKITRVLIRALSVGGAHPGFWAFGLFFVGANILKALLDVANKYAILRIKYAVQKDLIGEALAAFFKARWEFFSGTDQGRLLNTVNRELANIGDTLGQLATQFAQLVQLAIYLIVPLWLNPMMTLTAFGLAVILGSPILILHKVAYRYGQRNTETGNVMLGTLNEILGAARLVFGFGRQEQSRTRFLYTYDQHVGATLKSQTLDATAGAFFQPIGMLAAVVALGIALYQGTPVAEMAAILFSMLRLLPLLGGVLSTNVSISSFLPSYEQLVSLRMQAAALKEVEGDRIFQRINERIELKGVTFTYPGRHRTISEVSLTIRKGRMTALVGESGSGKSTITDLVLGLQIPDRGEVLLDGIPLPSWKQNSFRERVGYVPQDPILFHASIRDNLLWSLPQSEESELWASLRMANAESFVKHLPAGIDTMVGERGMRLSGGQRQRIALARALLRRPELLILDEATSALDSESEQLIQQSIEKVAEETTILIVAHRLSTIAKADYVYVLADGAVAEEGTYAELSRRRGGMLAHMIEAQRPVKDREIEGVLPITEKAI